MRFCLKQLALICLVGCAGLLVGIFSRRLLDEFDPDKDYALEQRRMVDRVLGADPQALLAAGRSLRKTRVGYIGDLDLSDPSVPPVIAALKPTRITFRTNCVLVDFSDPSNPFGIVAYDLGSEGRGPHKWIDGLWLFDDGQLNGVGQPGSPPRVNQPVRLGTN